MDCRGASGEVPEDREGYNTSVQRQGQGVTARQQGEQLWLKLAKCVVRGDVTAAVWRQCDPRLYLRRVLAMVHAFLCRRAAVVYSSSSRFDYSYETRVRLPINVISVAASSAPGSGPWADDV